MTEEAAALLDRGFEDWQMVTLLSQGEAVREIPVENGAKDSVRVLAGQDVAAPVRLDSWPDLLLDLPDTLHARVEQGQVVGTARLMDEGKTLITVPLYAAESVPESTFRFQLERILWQWLLGDGR